MHVLSELCLGWRGGFVRVSFHMILKNEKEKKNLFFFFILSCCCWVSKGWGFWVVASRCKWQIAYHIFVYLSSHVWTPLCYEMNIIDAHLNVWLIGAPLTLNRKHLNRLVLSRCHDTLTFDKNGVQPCWASSQKLNRDKGKNWKILSLKKKKKMISAVWNINRSKPIVECESRLINYVKLAIWRCAFPCQLCNLPTSSWSNGIDFCYPQRIVGARHYWAKSPETIRRLNRFAIELEKK